MQRIALAHLLMAFVGLLGARGARAQEMPMPSAARPANPPSATPPPPPALVAPLAPAPRVVPPGSPVVTLRANLPRATLQVRTWLTWDDLCTAPCGIPVDSTKEYRVAEVPSSFGRGSFGPSDPFNLAGRSGPVTVDARLGRRATRILGMALTLGGIAIAPIGNLLYVKGRRSYDSAMSSILTDGVPPHDIGTGLLVVAIAAVAVGIPLWATSTTSVEVQSP